MIKERKALFNLYFPHHFGCTGFADSIHSVSDLRFLLSSFAFMFAPATQTANAQSVTFGSIFQFYLGLTNWLRFLLA